MQEARRRRARRRWRAGRRKLARHWWLSSSNEPLSCLTVSFCHRPRRAVLARRRSRPCAELAATSTRFKTGRPVWRFRRGSTLPALPWWGWRALTSYFVEGTDATVGTNDRSQYPPEERCAIAGAHRLRRRALYRALDRSLPRMRRGLSLRPFGRGWRKRQVRTESNRSGDLHRRLGLPAAFYLPVSHVLSRTPSAVDLRCAAESLRYQTRSLQSPPEWHSHGHLSRS